MRQPWPGNVRELRNVADRFVLGLAEEDAERPASLPEQLEQFERALIAETLRRQHGELTATAKTLQIPKQTLYDKMRRLKLSGEAFRDEG
jgi:two-component system, NtrC family, C4-dicarboxylate transport response regulator DctD